MGNGLRVRGGVSGFRAGAGTPDCTVGTSEQSLPLNKWPFLPPPLFPLKPSSARNLSSLPVPASAQECAIGHFEDPPHLPQAPSQPQSSWPHEGHHLLFGNKMVAKERWCFLVGRGRRPRLSQIPIRYAYPQVGRIQENNAKACPALCRGWEPRPPTPGGSPSSLVATANRRAGRKAQG